MKKFKKSEIAIYVIAIMLVTAGYFNYENFNKNVENTYTSNIESESNKTENIGDAVLVSSNDVKEEKNEVNLENEQTENLNNSQEDYYANSKLERNKMFAEMVTNYENIINNTNSSEVQKSIAVEEIKKINNNKNAIMICENIILTKDFKECVIFMNDDSVNIVVKTEGGLTTGKVAIIQNIISRELKIDIENIHITEK